MSDPTTHVHTTVVTGIMNDGDATMIVVVGVVVVVEGTMIFTVTVIMTDDIMTGGTMIGATMTDATMIGAMMIGGTSSFSFLNFLRSLFHQTPIYIPFPFPFSPLNPFSPYFFQYFSSLF